jgi:excisionase family DNA binding protein
MLPDPASSILTLPEAARALRCSLSHVRNIIGGRFHDLPPLPILRIGRRVLIRHDALMTWLAFLEGREIEQQKGTGFFR